MPNPLIVGFIVFTLVLAGAFAGWTIQQRLPKHHLTASALALASSALAALPAVADDNDYFVLTQPNGKKIVISPISIIAIALPSEGLCKGETLIVTGPAKFCVIEQPEDVIKKLRDFPCVENPRTSAQTLRRCK